MSQNNQQGFSPVILPWFGQQQTQYRPQPQEQTPARVQVAMEFLGQMTFKTMERAAVNDLTIEWAPPKELSIKEKDALNAACSLLEEYFKGGLKPSRSEKLVEQQIKGILPDQAGEYLVCPTCEGRTTIQNARCRMCKGTGAVFIYPANKE